MHLFAFEGKIHILEKQNRKQIVLILFLPFQH